MIGYMIGFIGGFILLTYLKHWLEDQNKDLDQKIPRWLSKDKEPEYYNGGYIIYANGSRWYIEVMARYKLQWIPESMGDAKIQIQNQRMVEYECVWLPDMEKYKHMKRIIFTHPNLKAPNLYWSIVKAFS